MIYCIAGATALGFFKQCPLLLPALTMPAAALNCAIAWFISMLGNLMAWAEQNIYAV